MDLGVFPKPKVFAIRPIRLTTTSLYSNESYLLSLAIAALPYAKNYRPVRNDDTAMGGG